MSDLNMGSGGDASPMKFYQRDKRWLVSVSADIRLQRGDYAEVARSNGAVRVVQIQDEVLVGSNGTGSKRFHLFKDVTELYEQGYLTSSQIERFRNLDGSWWGWGLDVSSDS